MEKNKELIKGGSFLLKESLPENLFSPEDHTEEQTMLRNSIRNFLDKEIEPNKEIFDSAEGVLLAPEKLEKLGDLGFLGLSVPEEQGGFGSDIKTDLVASEIMSDSFSFSQTLGIQRGLGINTILFYGNKDQKEKYLEGIINGKIKCSYCLTEPSAGSDAMSGKTKAVYSEDGKHFILNGQKMWITNSGFADVFSVFCKIEDDPKLSCLLVEKEWGIKLGVEEKKLGIHGSSTRQVFFEDVKVPIENLLGERNKGFKIAMNALNMGRLMIGIAGSAIAKRAFRLGVSYANQRIQFGKPISSFGAIQEKIAKMATYIFALESAWHRLGGDMDMLMDYERSNGVDQLTAKQKVAAEFATECAIIKVVGSEVEQFVVDEALQIHGGMGFSGESEISVLYRNIRGNRIYEGTNEINRLVIPGTILKKGFSGELPLMEEIMSKFAALKNGELSVIPNSPAAEDFTKKIIANIKTVAILSIGIAAQKYQGEIKNAQEVLSRLADILSHTYLIESSILRSQKETSSPIHRDLMLLYIYDKMELMKTDVKELVFNCSTEKEALDNFKGLKKLIELPYLDLINLRRKVAAHFIDQNYYKL